MFSLGAPELIDGLLAEIKMTNNTINHLFFSIVPESPRWLVLHGRTDEASLVLMKFSNKSSRLVEYDLLRSVLDSCQRGEAETRTATERHSPLDLLRTPRMRKRTLIFWFCW